MSAEQKDGLQPPLDTFRNAAKAYFAGEITLEQYQKIKWGGFVEVDTIPSRDLIGEKTALDVEKPEKMTLFERIKRPIDVFVARLRG